SSDLEPISRLSYRTLRRRAPPRVTAGRISSARLPPASRRSDSASRSVRFPAGASIRRNPSARHAAWCTRRRDPAAGDPVTGVWRCRHAASVPSADQDGFPPFFVAETRSKPVEIQVTIGKKA
ncbi:hypothetical protein, partial [Rhodoplanes serenus]|uniref:hypothetical protein n=1 Tax=Rhodoplanes serenus TaxID=200615 RepID=UPI001AED1173